MMHYTCRPQFMAAYFDEPDEAGHAGGPNSDLVSVYSLASQTLLFRRRVWLARIVHLYFK